MTRLKLSSAIFSGPNPNGGHPSLISSESRSQPDRHGGHAKLFCTRGSGASVCRGPACRRSRRVWRRWPWSGFLLRTPINRIQKNGQPTPGTIFAPVFGYCHCRSTSGWDWDATVLRVHHALYAGTREREGREALRQFLANCLHTMIPQIDIGVAEGNGRHRAHFPVRAVAVFTPTTLLKNLAMRGAFVIQFLSRTPGGDASMHAGATYKESIYSNLTLCIAALFYHYFSAPAECSLPPHIVEVVLKSTTLDENFLRPFYRHKNKPRPVQAAGASTGVASTVGSCDPGGVGVGGDGGCRPDWASALCLTLALSSTM